MDAELELSPSLSIQPGQDLAVKEKVSHGPGPEAAAMPTAEQSQSPGGQGRTALHYPIFVLFPNFWVQEFGCECHLLKEGLA